MNDDEFKAALADLGPWQQAWLWCLVLLRWLLRPKIKRSWTYGEMDVVIHVLG